MKESSLKINALLNIVYKLSNIIFPLIVYPYVARVLLASNMGKISFFTSLTNYMVMLGSLGISTYGIRTVAKVKNSKKELSVVVKELIFINVITTTIIFIFLFVSTFYVTKFQNNFFLLIISCLQILISPLNIEWLYSGLEKYAYITKRAIFFRVVSVFLIFTFVRQKEDYVIYAGIIMFSCVGNYFCNMINSFKYIDFKTKTNVNLKRHLKSIFILFASILAINIYTNLDTVMLGFINGDYAVGLYDVACKAKLVLLSLINAISIVLFPRLSYYLSKNNMKVYKAILSESIIIIFAIAIPMALFFELTAQDVILVLGGDGYLKATLCMQILMPILIISGFSNITGNQILLPHGRDAHYMKAVMAGAILDVVLNIYLMPRYSLYGAAIATLIAEFTQMCIQVYYAKEYLKENLDIKEIIKILNAGILSFICVYIFSCIFKFIPFVNLVIYFIFYMICYLICLILFKVKILMKYFKQLLNFRVKN